MKSQAVVFTAPGKVEFQTIDCPDPGPDDVVVKVLHSWISNGTEGSYLRGERIAGDTPFRNGDAWPFPIVSGYQKIGIVESFGKNVTDLERGELVFAVCGNVSGMFESWGGHVNPSVTPRGQVFKLPFAPDPLAYAGLVLTQVGYNCGIRSPIKSGQAAIVVGDGLVGHWAAQTLAWRGAHVLMVGKHENRLRHFAGKPFQYTHNLSVNPDWIGAANALFPQRATVAVDTVGAANVMESFFHVLHRFGHAVSAGFYGTADQISLQPLRYGELSIDLVSGWQKDRMVETIRLIAAGYLETLPLITHHFPARKAAKAWELIESKSEPVLGVILDWD
ncbi:MAG TPA: zinc-binding dehydrogenase [Oceanipulchritudo sp.]|nr:zinc-binding dehydrogenase [Oceanipulchritudo sp.]